MKASDYVALPAVEPDLRTSYGDADDQFIDLYLPATAPAANGHPTALLIHGGCWREHFGLAPLGQMARALAEAGIAAGNIEYRRVGGAGGWPWTFLDVAAGAEHLGHLAPVHALDVSRLIVAGHSAGGHLALWLAGRGALPADSDLAAPGTIVPAAVVSIAGIGSLSRALSEGVCGDGPARLLGGTPEAVPVRYQQASPDLLLPLGVPHWHIVGADDPLVPAAFVERFVDDARSTGDTVHLTTVAGVGHFEVVTASEPAFHEVLSAFTEAGRTLA